MTNRLQVGTLVDGRYLLEAQIGRGGMARVFSAVNQKNGERVAVKEIDLPEDEEDRRVVHGWFRRELKALMAIQHPCVVKLIDHGEHEGLPFVVTELLQGTDLQAALETRGTFDDKSVYSIAMQGLDALAMAHRLSVVHRDLKPGNLFLCDNGRVVVLDFGLARGIDTNVSLSLQKGFDTKILGTPQYWSPEQIQGVTLSIRSDLFSFGATLFALLVGKPPHAGETPFEVAAKIMTKQRQKLLDARPETNTHLASAIESLLEYEPEKRPENAAAALALFAKLKEEFGHETHVVLRPPKRGVVATDSRRRAEATQVNAAIVTPTRIDARLAESTRVARPAMVHERAPVAKQSSKAWLALSAVFAVFALAGGGGWLLFRPAENVVEKGEPRPSTTVVLAPVPSLSPSSSPSSLALPEPTPATVPVVPPPAPADHPSVAADPTLVDASPAERKPEPRKVKPLEDKRLAPEDSSPGTLKLTLKQWAEVEIDGAAKGRQQIAAEFALAPGKHQIVLRHAKFGERRLTVTIKPKQETVLRHDFTAD